MTRAFVPSRFRSASRIVFLWCCAVFVISAIALRVEAAIYASRIVSVVTALSTLRVGETSKAETLRRIPVLQRSPQGLTAHLAAMPTSVSQAWQETAYRVEYCGEPKAIFCRMYCGGGVFVPRVSISGSISHLEKCRLSVTSCGYQHPAYRNPFPLHHEMGKLGWW
jgi:hypothetical protein